MSGLGWVSGGWRVWVRGRWAGVGQAGCVLEGLGSVGWGGSAVVCAREVRRTKASQQESKGDRRGKKKIEPESRGHPGCCHTSSVGKGVSFCKHVAAVAADGGSGDVDRCKELLRSTPASPARPQAMGARPKRFGSGWARFVGQAQGHDQLCAPIGDSEPCLCGMSRRFGM